MLPTKAKSPKLGTQKNSPMAVTEENSQNNRLGRLSLDEKTTKRSSPQPLKKPLRKSLPKLPSDKATLASGTDNTASLTQSQVHEEAECGERKDKEQASMEPETEPTSC